MKPPAEANTDKVWRLKKAVYGLKDAARAWYRSVVGHIQKLGGVRSNRDPRIFMWRTEKRLIGLMCPQVDDFFYGGGEDFERDVVESLKKSLEWGYQVGRYCING